MKATTVGPVATTRLGFGTSRLHYLDSSVDRQRILAAAYEAGIRHFDTAPAYGHGLAEREIGRFLRGRDDCVVVTKHGTAATPWIGGLPDSLLKPAIFARSVVSRAFRRDSAVLITPSGLRDAVEASLRRLRRDVIDIHLLHEPERANIRDFDSIVATYERLIAEGKIRAAGIAGAFETALLLLDHACGFVLQTDESEWTEGRSPDITYGAISRGPQTRTQVAIAAETARIRDCRGGDSWPDPRLTTGKERHQDGCSGEW